ncbi:MAG TPA: HAD hydrolase-like protein [Patescibacteria group bacterium]|nr:HAD hydrolase-like protein [Patescibacteria group bacterium]
MKKYSTIFLDWSGTLSNSYFWGHWQNKAHPNYVSFNLIQQILFHDLWDEFGDDWMRGKYSSEEIITRVAKEIKHDYKFLFNEFVNSCKEMTFSSNDINDLLIKLKRQNKKIVIATDNMDSFTRWTIPSMELTDLFDDILNSFDLKLLKEDTDKEGRSMFFENYINNHQVKRENCVLIDDSKDLEEIVQKSGMDYLQVTNQKPLSYHLKNLLNES